MSWPWLKTAAQDGRGPMAAESPDLLGRADALRDARRWGEAADAYQAVLEGAPRRAAIWVQLGHARKESGAVAEAEAAYRRSLELSPDVADTYLQLGQPATARKPRL